MAVRPAAESSTLAVDITQRDDRHDHDEDRLDLHLIMKWIFIFKIPAQIGHNSE